ncbi:MAG: glycosyltransferase family 4 protein [Opitutaceae bacterium]|nr:glycosyltransferase family 4 protein [Opitutaceae bacterium]
MRTKRTLMYVENAYPQDLRIKNEAELLTDAGYDVTVIAIGIKGQSSTEVINGVKVYRVPLLVLFEKTPKKDHGFFGVIALRLKSVLGYVTEYAYFTSACFFLSLYILLKNGFDVIHAHNPPDTLCIAAFPFRLIGKKFVFDHHDLCPELYQSRYETKVACLQTRLLSFFEWCSLKLASITIATNESYKEIHVKRGGMKPENVFVVRNGPNESRMKKAEPTTRLRNMGKSILVYIGSLNPQDGVDYLIRSLKILKDEFKREDFYCIIMGSGDSLKDLKLLTTELELDDHIELTGYISDEDLLSNLAAADICMDPDPASPLNNLSTWIKIMEYMAHEKPIVTFDLKETRYSAQDAAVYVEPNDEEAFARATAELMDDPDRRKAMGEFARKRVENELQWTVVGQNLIKAYEHLTK